MLQVHVKPEEVWNYFEEHKKRLEDVLDVIAEVSNNEASESLYKLYITSEKGYPYMTVEAVTDDGDETVIYKECAISQADCETTYKNLLEKLEKFDQVSHSSSVDSTDFEVVSEREEELREALAVFLNALLGIDGDIEVAYEEEELTEMLDAIETLIGDGFGYQIYRPKIVEINGQYKLLEFPYEEEDFYEF